MTPAHLNVVVDNTTEDALAWSDPRTAIVIASNDGYVAIAEDLKLVKAFQKKVAEFFAPLKAKAQAAHRALCEAEREKLAPAEAYERKAKAALSAWDQEQDRLRRVEEQRLAEEARKREEERRIAEAAAMETEAQAIGDDSLMAEAQALITQPIETPTVILPKATPVVTGISYREVWSASVTDLVALVKHIAAHPEHLHLVQPNQTALNGLARALKGHLAIPGVKATSDRQVAAGAGRR